MTADYRRRWARCAQLGLRHCLDRLLPPVCLVCGDPLPRDAGRVCGLCWARAPQPRHPLCVRCGISLHDIGVYHPAAGCIECERWLPYLRVARAPYQMGGSVAAMVHALKYGGWRELADEMGASMARQKLGAAVETEIAAVAPVPLSTVRLRERGFNQAELLATSLAKRRGWPLLGGVLVRARHTGRQARLAPDARRSNVAGAFSVPAEKSEVIADAHLLLVDDVLTTGATVNDCVRALCRAGARAVSVVTFARARTALNCG